MKKRNHIRLTMISIFLISMTYTIKSQAQVKTNSGPRFGITVVTPGLLSDILNGDRDLGMKQK